MNVKRQEETLAGWSIIWWLFKLFGIPVTIPWLIYHLFNIVQQKRKRAALSSKVVMITGASSGLGEALAHTFYRYGCRIILVSRRKEELERVKNDLINTHQTVPTHPPIVLPLDLTEINNLEDEVSKAIMIHGRIDILINNAGISYRGEVINTNVDVDIKVMLSNYFSQVALSKIMDKTTESGYQPEYVAECVLKSILKQEEEVTIAPFSPKVAIVLRTLFPSLFFWIMQRRARKSAKNK
ncbi:hypothetical protein ACFW04_002304 [Cataglyphis niger]